MPLPATSVRLPSEPILRTRAEELGAELRYRTECTSLKQDPDGVTATLRDLETGDSERTVRARYLVGGDGAHSAVRAALGHRLQGESAMHAWGVMDVMANTDFPDFQVKCSIQSHDAGNILLIPREGGYLSRLYVDLGEVDERDPGAVRATPIEAIIA